MIRIAQLAGVVIAGVVLGIVVGRVTYPYVYRTSLGAPPALCYSLPGVSIPALELFYPQASRPLPLRYYQLRNWKELTDLYHEADRMRWPS